MTGSPAKPDDRVEDDIGTGRRGHQARNADEHLSAGRDAVAHHPGERLVADDHNLGVQLGRLGQQCLRGALGRQGDDPEPLGLAPQYIDGLGADRAGRSQQADGAHQLTRGGTL